MFSLKSSILKTFCCAAFVPILGFLIAGQRTVATPATPTDDHGDRMLLISNLFAEGGPCVGPFGGAVTEQQALELSLQPFGGQFHSRTSSYFQTVSISRDDDGDTFRISGKKQAGSPTQESLDELYVFLLTVGEESIGRPLMHGLNECRADLADQLPITPNMVGMTQSKSRATAGEWSILWEIFGEEGVWHRYDISWTNRPERH